MDSAALGTVPIVWAAWVNDDHVLVSVAIVVMFVFALICLLISRYSHRLERLERESLRRHVRHLR